MTMRFDFAGRPETLYACDLSTGPVISIEAGYGFGEAHVNRLSNPELTILRKSRAG